VKDEDASSGHPRSLKPIDPALRGAEYRKEGWKSFDPALAYRPTGRDRKHAPRTRLGG
jgi:hypothetical protein